jgi:hypothetical protein
MRHKEQAVSPVPGAGVASPRSASPAGGQASPEPVVTHASPSTGVEAGLDADYDDEAPL